MSNTSVVKQLPKKETSSPIIVLDIPVLQLLLDPHQPRKQFDDQALEELGRSIKSQGLQQLPVVNFAYKKDGKDFYFIKAGERRWRAHKRFNMTHLKCVVDSKPYDGTYNVNRVLAQAAENSSREFHTHGEIISVTEAVVKDEMSLRGENHHGAIQSALQRVAEAFGKSIAWASNYLVLTRLVPDLRAMLDLKDDDMRLNFNVACSLARAPADVQADLHAKAKLLAKHGGHSAMQRFITLEARAIREGRGEKIRGKKPYEERESLRKLINTLYRLSERFCGSRHSSEHKLYVQELLAQMSTIEVDEMLGDLKLALTTFSGLQKALETSRTRNYEKLKS